LTSQVYFNFKWLDTFMSHTAMRLTVRDETQAIVDS
jgi:hypothetical protein